MLFGVLVAVVVMGYKDQQKIIRSFMSLEKSAAEAARNTGDLLSVSRENNDILKKVLPRVKRIDSRPTRTTIRADTINIETNRAAIETPRTTVTSPPPEKHPRWKVWR